LSAQPVSFNHLARRTLYLFAFIAFVIVLFVSAAFETVKLKREISFAMKGAATSCAALIQDTLLADSGYIEKLIRNMPAGDDSLLKAYFSENIPLVGSHDHFFVLSPEGVVIFTDRGNEDFVGLDFSQLDYLPADKNISKVHQSYVDYQPVVTIRYDLPMGRKLLLEKDVLSIAPLVRHLTINVPLEKALIFILSESGTIVYHPDTDLVNSRFPLGFQLKDWTEKDIFGLQTYSNRGEKYVCYRQPIDPPKGWMFYAAFPQQEMYELVGRHLLTMAFGVAAIIIVMMVSLQTFISSRLSRPIAAIAGYLSALNPMEDGEPVRPKIDGDTAELNTILKAAERMAANIRSSKEKLVDSEELFRTVTEFSTDLVFWLSPEEELIYISPSCRRITGYSPEEFYQNAKLMRDIIHPDDRVEYVSHLGSILDGEPDKGLEYRLMTKEGQVRWMSHICSPIRDARGNFLGTRGRNADITVRKLAEESLRDSEGRFRTLVEHGADIFLVHEHDGKIIDVNQRASDVLGYSREELLKMQVSDLDPYYSPEDVRKVFDSILPGETFTLESTYRCKDGTEFFVEVRSSVVKWGSRSLIFSLVRDVNLRRMAQEQLAAEKELLSVTLRSIGDGVIATNEAGRVALLNKVAEKLTGWTQTEAAGLPLEEVFQLIHEESGIRCENPAQAILKSGQIVASSNSMILVARDGTERPVAKSGAPIRDRQSRVKGVVLVFRDIVEERRLEREAQKAQRLESLGLLAGGIAHDFNNLLTVILGNISFVRLHINETVEDHRRLLAAEKASEKARRLTHQLLTFAKGGTPVKEVASIAEIVRETAEFALHGSKARVEFEFSEDLMASEVDTGQISQVFHNILINADQAMPQGGVVRIEARNVDIHILDERGLTPGPYIRISFRDNGEGIEPEHLDRIFDPYFTTKERGNGLGLATCYSIIKQHDGHIEVESVPGEGSTFQVYLPATGKARPVQPIEKKLVPGKGRVLVMDDEEMVRDLAGAALAALGYETVLAGDGGEAVDLYEKALKAGKPFDVVIMDLTIPGGIGGKEAIQLLRKIDPQVKAVVSSGYAQDPIMANYADYGFSAVLAKPYSIKYLGETMQAIISGAKESGGKK